MRWTPYLVMAVTVAASTVVQAQEIKLSGWVDRVDMANSTLTIRSLGGTRTLQIAPNATVRMNGAVMRLDQLPANAQVSITAQKGPNDVITATQLEVRSGAAQQPAAAPVGSVVRGRLVGMNIPQGTVTVRTTSGDHAIPLGSAPIIVNGAAGSTRNLRVGQTLQIERALPTGASTEFVTQSIRVLPAATTGAEQAAQPAQATAARSTTLRSKTKAYRSSTGSRLSSSRSNVQRSRANARYRAQEAARQGRSERLFIGLMDQPAAAPRTAAGRSRVIVVGPGGATTGAAPATAAAPSVIVAPGAVVDTGTAGVPGVIVAPGTVVAPGAVVAPGGGVAPGVAAPGDVPAQTTTADPRFQAGATAENGVATGEAGFVDQGTALAAPLPGDAVGAPGAATAVLERASRTPAISRLSRRAQDYPEPR